MSSERGVTRIVRSWLEEGPSFLPDRVIDAVEAELPVTPQRRAGWLARRFPIMNSSVLRLGIAAAAVVLVAFIGMRLLGSPSNTGGPAASASPSPTPEPLASATAEPTLGWLSGAIEPGRHEVLVEGHSFSFAVEQPGWSTAAFPAMIIKGPPTEQRWIAFFNPFDQVSTDPCTATAQTVGPTIDDFANAMTSIPGTDAEGPTDTTVGGLPAKLVVLTIHDDIDCSPQSFWLYGENSAYPNRLDSVMSAWIVEVNGTRYVFQSHHADTDAGAEQEIHQIIDSLEFN